MKKFFINGILICIIAYLTAIMYLATLATIAYFVNLK
jgi:hypothetical protein